VKNADKIICMKEGEVVEQGTHEFLMSQRGTYYNLVNNQIIDENKKCDSQSS
jgi:ABC-type multidrug transport system fused ATPase/permease subunit